MSVYIKITLYKSLLLCLQPAVWSRDMAYDSGDSTLQMTKK